MYRARWAIWGAALGIGVAIGAMVALSHKHSNASADDSAVSTWPAGARPAPAFTLTDEHGKSFSLASLRGRSAIVTFIDPLCRDFCPREASILTEAAAKLGAKAPAIVSVSVDPWADTATNFQGRRRPLEARRRPGAGEPEPTPSSPASGSPTTSASRSRNKTIAGVKVRYITHTGAAYLIDANGDERALFLYPFTTDQVVSAAQALDAS